MKASAQGVEASAQRQRADQGTMISRGLMAMLRDVVGRELSGSVADDADKVHLLTAVWDSRGPAAVVEVGLGLPRLGSHPVFEALAARFTPVRLLERWTRLERFGHTRNRTRILSDDVDSDHPCMSLEHFAVDGGAIHPVNDLFVWGLLIALLERSGLDGLVATLTPSAGEPVALYRQGAVAPLEEPPVETGVLTVRWRPTRRAPCPEQQLDDSPSAPVRSRLATLFADDLLETWRLEDAARSLGLSTRSLQRRLRAEGTHFSETLHRTRLDAARGLLGDPRLSLTEIAFSTGFADLAHFSRLFRRYLDIPPSAFRQLLMEPTSTLRPPGHVSLQ